MTETKYKYSKAEKFEVGKTYRSTITERIFTVLFVGEEAAFGKMENFEAIVRHSNIRSFELREEVKSGKVWVNVYPKGIRHLVHETRGEADRAADPDRIACIEVKFEEGDGL